MTVGQWDLQKALFSKLNADSGIVAFFGTDAPRIYDEPPPNATYPFLQIGDAVASDWGARDIIGYKAELTIIAWSQGERGRSKVKQAGDAIHAALHLQSLSVPGHSVVQVRFLSSTTGSDDGITWRGENKFIITLHK